MEKIIEAEGLKKLQTMWNKIKEIIRSCAYIVLGEEIAAAAFISIFYPGTSLSVALLWEILTSSFVCALIICISMLLFSEAPSYLIGLSMTAS